MSLDGLCELDCGAPATEAVALPVTFNEGEREEHYFCASHAHELRALASDLRQPVDRPCPACGHPLDFKGEDRDGREVWRCLACDTFGE